MDTKKFRSKQEFLEVSLPTLDDRYIIGLDVGYGQVKCATEKTIFIFPAYVKRLYEMVNIEDPNDLLYRDEKTGEIYMIGYEAQNMIVSSDADDTYGDMFSRKRYGTKSFRILYHVAMGLALYTKTDDRPIFIESGLPSSFLTGDITPLTRALTTPAEFSLKWGQRKWRKFSLSLENSMVNIISQPAGSLYSTLVGLNGKFIPNAKPLMKKNILVLDAGFKTIDLHGTQARSKSAACKESMNDSGMYQVFADTSKKIMEKFDEDVQVAAIQKNLEKGTVLRVTLGENGYVSTEEDIAPLLEEANRKVCLDALKRLMETHNNLQDYEILIITGGTGEAWYDIISDYLKGLKHIQIIPANQNTKLPLSYSNAVGYYLYAYISSKPKRQG